MLLVFSYLLLVREGVEFRKELFIGAVRKIHAAVHVFPSALAQSSFAALEHHEPRKDVLLAAPKAPQQRFALLVVGQAS